MNRDDAIAIELAAERRRHDEAKQAEEDARRAELPRVMREARREPVSLLRRLMRVALSALAGKRG